MIKVRLNIHARQLFPGVPTPGFHRRNQRRQEVVGAPAGRLREGQPVDGGSQLCQRRDDRFRRLDDARTGGFQVRGSHTGRQLDAGATELARRCYHLFLLSKKLGFRNNYAPLLTSGQTCYNTITNEA